MRCPPPPLDGSEASAKFLAERFRDSIPKSHITLPDTADTGANVRDFTDAVQVRQHEGVMLIELESNFWHHVEELTVPPLDGSTASAKFLADRFRRMTYWRTSYRERDARPSRSCCQAAPGTRSSR